MIKTEKWDSCRHAGTSSLLNEIPWRSVSEIVGWESIWWVERLHYECGFTSVVFVLSAAVWKTGCYSWLNCFFARSLYTLVLPISLIVSLTSSKFTKRTFSSARILIFLRIRSCYSSLSSGRSPTDPTPGFKVVLIRFIGRQWTESKKEERKGSKKTLERKLVQRWPHRQTNKQIGWSIDLSINQLTLNDTINYIDLHAPNLLIHSSSPLKLLIIRVMIPILFAHSDKY